MAGLIALGCLATGTIHGQTPPAKPASAPPTLEQMFKQGADAFVGGDYTRTITLFTDILKQAKPSPALEPVYFTIAAAKLRKGDNDGAIAAFRLYLQTYPTGSQINDARAGLTKALIAAKRMPRSLGRHQQPA